MLANPLRLAAHSVPALEALARLRRLRRAADRFEARIRFGILRKRRLTTLTGEQIAQFRRDGYLVVPGLVPTGLVEAARAAMWERLEADPRNPESWSRLGWYAPAIRDRRMLETYTDEMMAAAAQLTGKDVACFRPPRVALPINSVPVGGDWQFHPPHLDRSMPEMRSRTFPPPYWIGAMTYLTGARSHEGCTVVWPGSHLRMEALARREPGAYGYLAALGKALEKVELGSPVEVEVSPGDVFFHHYLLVHTGSRNLGRTPRLAINHKW